MTKEEKICSLRSYASGVYGGMVRICDLLEFSSHPFKVVKDAAMYELMKSIRMEGVYSTKWGKHSYLFFR